jgi:hypothetical protein
MAAGRANVMTTIVRREIRKRGFFGKLFKVLFIAFNLVMLAWVISYWMTLGHGWDEYTKMPDANLRNAAQGGYAIGATIGTSLLLFFWAAGDVVLGLLTMFTRGKKTIIEEVTH